EEFLEELLELLRLGSAARVGARATVILLQVERDHALFAGQHHKGLAVLLGVAGPERPIPAPAESLDQGDGAVALAPCRANVDATALAERIEEQRREEDVMVD